MVIEDLKLVFDGFFESCKEMSDIGLQKIGENLKSLTCLRDASLDFSRFEGSKRGCFIDF